MSSAAVQSAPTAAATSSTQDASASTTSSSSRGRQRNRRGRGGKASTEASEVAGDGQATAQQGNATARGGRGGGRGQRGAARGRGGAGRGGAATGRQGAQQQQSGTATPVEQQQGEGSAPSAATPLDAPPHGNHSHSHPHSRQQSRNTSRSRAAQEPNGDNAPAANTEAGRGGRGGNRRARFNAALSSSTNSTLAPSATPFNPKTTVPAPPIPAPASQTLLSRLTLELTAGTYDCSICFSNLSRTVAIHSCTTCSTPFHLTCIREWATRSVTDSAERAQLLATRNTSTPADPASLAGSWRCPSCQTSSTPADIPKTYRCYCLRLRDPPHRPPATPHSCGQPCARPRPEGCTHSTCGLLCHPGPCPPCSVVLEMPCHCGGKSLHVRCSAIHGVKGGVMAGAPSRSELLSCRETCGKVLGCGLHRCERECHEGECGGCGVEREKKCFCGKSEVVEDCGIERDERVEGCCRPTADADAEKETWVGEWSCEKECGAPYDCTHHSCTLPCHPHTSSTTQPCPFSPSSVTTCPCTQTPLTDLLSTPRSTCLSPIPTCALPCPRLLSCGHPCTRTCHAGDCGACATPVSVVCRCGSSTTRRLCGDRQADGSPLDELLCGRVCKAMRSCGRHQCSRVCCPLSYQEALKAKSGKKRVALAEWQVEEDPLGMHTCDRTCGRKLNCGVHNCERPDHKGACPPCLRADFDELVCNCGSTVVLPPIPCSYVIDCRHPCIRPSPCGHQTMPHACHEDPACPPCPFLVEKACACGKKTVGNVRCSMDQKKVSCGTTCGKLLRCGFHRCRKSCHVAGECEACDQICLKPRKLCHHPCPLPCHSPTSCPTDSPCPKMITVTCACGHLQQSARCATCDAKPEGNQGRLLKCSDACAAAKRNQQLAEALGVEKREPRVREVEYDPLMMSFYGSNVAFCASIEAQLAEFVKSDKPSLHFPVMKRPQRAFTHELAELFDLRSESLDEEPRRSVVVHRQSNSAIPTPTLADALSAQRKSASTLLTFGSLRKAAVPERKPCNAVFLEGVLGFDEAMLKDILRPLTKGLIFSCTWVGEEDVLVTFDYSVGADLEIKVASMCSSFRTLAEDTGFCATVEAVHLSPADGSITRGAWTPVASSSRSGAGGSGSRSHSHTPVSTSNPFASLGGGAPAPAPMRNAWGAGGGVVGPAAYKPPRAVIAPVSSRERPLPPPHHSHAPTPRVPTPEPKVQDEKDVPESWDAEEEVEVEAAVADE